MAAATVDKLYVESGGKWRYYWIDDLDTNSGGPIDGPVSTLAYDARAARCGSPMTSASTDWTSRRRSFHESALSMDSPLPTCRRFWSQPDPAAFGRPGLTPARALPFLCSIQTRGSATHTAAASRASSTCPGIVGCPSKTVSLEYLSCLCQTPPGVSSRRSLCHRRRSVGLDKRDMDTGTKGRAPRVSGAVRGQVRPHFRVHDE